MKSIDDPKRETSDLTLAMIIASVLAFLNISMIFYDGIHAFFSEYAQFRLASFIVNLLFLWLVIMLWLAFGRWRLAVRQKTELEGVISGISPDVLLVVTRDRDIVICNQAVVRVFGYHPEDVLHQKTDLLYFDRRVNKNKPEIYQALEQDGFHVGQATGKRKNGMTFPLEIITGELKERGGAVLLLRDITDRIRAEEERRELEARVLQRQKLESLGVLSGGIAHDFNNMLTVILGNTELALSDLPPLASGRPHLEGIRNASRHAAELCRQLLAYAGKGRFLIQPLDLTKVVGEMGRLLEVPISKKATIRYRLAPNLPVIEADSAQIQQVVMNLITNASDALGGEEGEIALSTGIQNCDADFLRGLCLGETLPPGRYVFLEVSDTGCGMTDETKMRMFDPFFTTKLTGRGLGLASVLGIVRGHKGAMKVDSREGRGTTIRVLLPEGRRAAPSQPTVEPPAPWKGTGSILVVDDEDAIRDVAGQMLNRMGFTVFMAANGRDAIEVYRKHASQITAVLLDMTMPRMDGIEVLASLRRIRHDVRAIVSSGYAEEDTAARFSDGPPAVFIQKPFDALDLEKAVRKASATG